MQNEKIDLNCAYPQTYNFIVCHKPTKCLDMFGDLANRVYLSDNKLPGTIDVYNGYDSSRYGELPFWSWIAQHIRPQDFACLHHYRRKLPPSFGITLPAPIQIQGSMAQQLAYYHSPVLSDAIMKTLEPVEQQLFCTQTILYGYNIALMPGEILQNMYLPYISNKITLLEGVLGKNYRPDKTFFESREGKRTDTWYQNRIYGFAMERYNTLFWLQNRNLIQVNKNIVLLEPDQKI